MSILFFPRENCSDFSADDNVYSGVGGAWRDGVALIFQQQHRVYFSRRGHSHFDADDCISAPLEPSGDLTGDESVQSSDTSATTDTSC